MQGHVVWQMIEAGPLNPIEEVMTCAYMAPLWPHCQSQTMCHETPAENQNKLMYEGKNRIIFVEIGRAQLMKA